MEVINLPFDEPFESKIAQDYSGNGHNATLLRDYFTTGHTGNSMMATPYSPSRIAENPFDFSVDFTLYQWMFSEQDPAFPHQILVYVTFAGLTSQFLILNPNSSAPSWYLFTVSKGGNTIRLFRNAKEQDSFVIPGSYGQITGVYFVKKFTSAKPANMEAYGVYLDSVVGINGEAHTVEEINEEILKHQTNVSYIINGVDLRDLGVVVKDARGIADRPEYKDVRKTEWADRHGTNVDLKNVRYKAREIELDCWFLADTKEDAVDKIMQIKDLISGNGFQRFQFSVSTSRVYPYDVYFSDELNFEIPKWMDGGRMAPDFTLKMIEPQPVKKVLKFTANSANGRTVNIKMNTNKENLSVFWGDKLATHNVRGATVNQSHTFVADGDYFITVAGVVENITNFVSNSVIVWNRLY